MLALRVESDNGGQREPHPALSPLLQSAIADIDELAVWCYGDIVTTHHTEIDCEPTHHYAG